MALIKCTECGTEVSDKASTCVKCGAPVQRPVATTAPAVNTSSVLKQTLPAWQVVAGLLLCLGMFWFFASLKPNEEPRPAEQKEVAPAPAAAVQPVAPRPLLNVSFSTAVSGVPPTLSIKTNLPEGTNITTFTVVVKRAPCFDCAPFMSQDLVVKDGTITVVPYFGEDKHYMRNEEHTLWLSVVPNAQPKEVQSVLGTRGELLGGPNTKPLEDLGILSVDYKTTFMVRGEQ